jgi:protein-tyrosine-phosphatase
MFMSKHARAAGAKMQFASASVHDQIRPTHPLVIQILSEQKLAPRRTNSQPLSKGLAKAADLIVTMTGAHAISVAGKFRDSRANVFMLDHFVQLMRPLAAHETLDDWLADLRRQPRMYPNHPGAQDIIDPVNKDEETFRAIATQIDGLTEQIVRTFVSKPA